MARIKLQNVKQIVLIAHDCRKKDRLAWGNAGGGLEDSSTHPVRRVDGVGA